MTNVYRVLCLFFLMDIWVFKTVIDWESVMLELIYFKEICFQKVSQILRLTCFIKIMFVFSHFFVFFLKTRLTVKRFIFRTLRNMLSSYLHYLIDLVNSSKKLFKMIPDFSLQEIRYIFLYTYTIVIIVLYLDL